MHCKKDYLCLTILIPEVVINSFLSAEDKNFFRHPGVDAKGILRAFIKNLKISHKIKD